jgi:hypothetical protein
MSKEKEMKCEICNKHKAVKRDYRFFSSFQGKIAVCDWCFNLDDVTCYQINQEGKNPKSFYNGGEANEKD